MPKTERESIFAALLGLVAVVFGLLVGIAEAAVIGVVVFVMALVWFAYQVSQRNDQPRNRVE